ncbi:MAG: acyltransferase [Candidatus Eremiobacteraeota bacterium]|nr:acyltransferase [Candidatus Eremiobacteraeota bacterium]
MARSHEERPGVSHVAVLDGLRGIAIAGVVWYHAWLVSRISSTLSIGHYTLDLQPLAQAGFMGVDLFFFVSGFCLFYPYARHVFEGKPLPTIADFAVRRAEKILPSYAVALAVFAIAHRSWFASTGSWVAHLAAHATFLHPLWFDTFGSISGPFWTLGIEVQFYLLFPLVCYLFRRQPLLMFAGLCVLANGYRLLVAHLGADTMLYPISQLPGVIDVFGSGMLAAYAIAYARRLPLGRRSRLVATSVTIAAVIAMVLLVQRLAAVAAATGDPGQYQWVNAHRPLFAALFLICGVGSTIALPGWQRLVAQPALVYLAAISYNLYLWHLEVIVWYQTHLSPFIRDVLHLPVASDLVLPMVLSLVVATLATRVVERPFLKGGWRLMAVRLRAAVSAFAALPPWKGRLLTASPTRDAGLHAETALAAAVQHVRRHAERRGEAGAPDTGDVVHLGNALGPLGDHPAIFADGVHTHP